mgnify:CR=1 FL=1
MTEQELREKIAKRICTLNPQVANWDILDSFYKGVWLGEADQILALIKEAGWKSPEECNEYNQRQIESERILNREAAYDERQLLDEVKYWKLQAG